jgi:hypothetical protein
MDGGMDGWMDEEREREVVLKCLSKGKRKCELVSE